MSDDLDPTARLEAALDRIAAVPPAPVVPADITARLDGLIAHLRDALDQ